MMDVETPVIEFVFGGQTIAARAMTSIPREGDRVELYRPDPAAITAGTLSLFRVARVLWRLASGAPRVWVFLEPPR